MKTRLLLGFFIILSQLGMGEQVTASSFKVKIKKVAVSTSGDCSNPIVVYDSGKEVDQLEYVDLASNTELFSNASVPNGTYECVIWEISDWVKFKVANALGSCSDTNTEYERDVCGFGPGSDSAGPPSTALAISLNPQRLIGASEETACDETSEGVKPFYFSTWSTNDTAGTGSDKPGIPPTTVGDAQRGFKLAAPLVVNGATQGILRFDTTNAIEVWNHDYTGATPTQCSPKSIKFSLE